MIFLSPLFSVGCCRTRVTLVLHRISASRFAANGVIVLGRRENARDLPLLAASEKIGFHWLFRSSVPLDLQSRSPQDHSSSCRRHVDSQTQGGDVHPRQQLTIQTCDRTYICSLLLVELVVKNLLFLFLYIHLLLEGVLLTLYFLPVRFDQFFVVLTLLCNF